jgi:hypothetical protein
MEMYRPRTIRFHGVRETRGTRTKMYSISWDGSTIDWSRFEAGISLVLSELPGKGTLPGRPGLGFVIAHHGRTADYVVLSWWDNENELPTRVRVCVEKHDSGWREAMESESFCIWDLEVMWFERESYVSTLLSGYPGDQSHRYLAFHAGVAADQV